MREIGTLKRSELRAVQSLWNEYRQTIHPMGKDLHEAFAGWTAREAQKLTPPPGAQKDFDELCRQGCVPQILAAVLAFIRVSPLLERVWTEIVGHPRKRQKLTRGLKRAVAVTEDVFGKLIAEEDESQKQKLARMGRIPLSRLVSELKVYIAFANLAEQLSAQMETRSLRELAVYLLCGYVKRSTAQFRDRNVSALLADVGDSFPSNEVAQRMWRNRNYKRLEKHHSKLAKFSFALGLVITRKT